MTVITQRANTTKNREITGTTTSVYDDLDKSDYYRPTITVIVLIVTSFIIGISFGLCFIWFAFIRRSKRKNKVRPFSIQDGVEITILQSKRSDVEINVANNEQSRSDDRRGKTNSITTMQNFHVVSKGRFEFSEVEI